MDGHGFTLQGHENGFFVGPSLFDHVTTDMQSYQEEISDLCCRSCAHPISKPRSGCRARINTANVAFETGLAQGLLTERRLFQLLTAIEDKKEGMAAFVARRPATWEGR